MIIIIILEFANMNGNAQTKIDMFEKLQINEEQIKKLDSTALKLIEKDNSLSKMQGLKLYHIFWLRNTDKIIKNDFWDYSFLNKLQISYDTILYRQCNLPLIKYLFKERKEYFFKVQTLITDSVGNLVGITFGHKTATPNTIDGIICGYKAPFVVSIGITDTTSFTYKLAKMFFNKQIDFFL